MKDLNLGYTLVSTFVSTNSTFSDVFTFIGSLLSHLSPPQIIYNHLPIKNFPPPIHLPSFTLSLPNFTKTPLSTEKSVQFPIHPEARGPATRGPCSAQQKRFRRSASDPRNYSSQLHTRAVRNFRRRVTKRRSPLTAPSPGPHDTSGEDYLSGASR